jgi:hypothetical protein
MTDVKIQHLTNVKEMKTQTKNKSLISELEKNFHNRCHSLESHLKQIIEK